MPCVFTESQLPKVREQAKAIMLAFNDKKGMKTYSTTWKLYCEWHKATYRHAAPLCPYTQLIWLNHEQGVMFMVWLGNNGYSHPQVCSHSLMGQ